MQAVVEHLAVVAMTTLMAWPVALGLAVLPVVLITWRLRGGNWRDRRRWQAAKAALLFGAPAGMLLAFLFVGGHPRDLGYWLDWLFLIALAIAIAIYLAVLVFWALPPRTVFASGEHRGDGSLTTKGAVSQFTTLPTKAIGP